MCLDNLGPGSKAPDLVNMFVEIPMNSSVKYELDEETCLVKVDRFLYTSMSYPFNYGFIPGTKSEDGDPIDLLLISREPIMPGSIIEAKPIGMLIMQDEEGPDSKIIAVPKEKLDPIYGSWNNVNDIPDFLKKKISHFFEHYKELEPGKWVKVTGWEGADKAKAEILNAVKRAKEEKA
ncbi:inorganic pyrophosphatase [Caldisphaera lagunensis DSM 15908]|uniref:Inorganic pyrophosphatase n=1 Tax=Caldisphaera lagunensis (strain DSM 15908 / JCM 11604 / ANMR 0165 / IC-154) TaxID=1056495 RepID=L0A8X3_CALLD|nr:inorganic diphosphatase [Caldisphaera lagunensis]AFZ70306.1 inorganic pyrophosphatase [Caldisphaera lagunensis DSM 15908]